MFRRFLLLLSLTMVISCGHKSQRSQAPHGFMGSSEFADLVLINGKVFSHYSGEVEAVAVKHGKFVAVGSNDVILKEKGPKTKVIDAKGKRVLPGLIDTHMHPIRAGLNYNLELRWDGVRTLKRALEMLREQAKRTPKGQWVRVVGGWSPHQFKENRFPTLKELNEAAPETPVFVLYLYSKAFINKAAIDYLKYDEKTRFPGGHIVLDKNGNLTGELIAKPSALLLYKTLVAGPSLNPKDKVNSTLYWIRELNRFGLTSVIDAGGGGFFYPKDHEIVVDLMKQDRLNIRYPFYLFAPNKGSEFQSFKDWIQMVGPETRSALHHGLHYHHLGAGENISWAAADFENFMEPRPDLPPYMESEIKPILKELFSYRWIFRIHATYNESITRILNVMEEIKKEGGAFPERFIIDHAETVSLRNLRRIKKLGGGISIQNRMAFQGEEFIQRYGKKKARYAPPIKWIKRLGVPLGSGTDATRVSTYNPFVSLHWKISGKTLGDVQHMATDNTLSRKEALYAMTKGAAWFSKEEDLKGDIRVGELADFFIVNKDYFEVDESEIRNLESELTILGGRPVYAAGEFSELSTDKLPEISPDWSPVRFFGGYQKR